MTPAPAAQGTKAEKANRTPHTKLDLIHNSEDFVGTVQKECRSWQYDVNKITQRLNCSRQQALTLIALAQIADAQPMAKRAVA